MTKQEFTTDMTYLGMAYGKEYTQAELEIHYDFLKEYNDATFMKAVKSIIKKSKFLPKITELLEECEKCKEQSKFEILEYMNANGYFKNPNEYIKASKFLTIDVIPGWFKEDMKKYYAMMNQPRLEQQNKVLIGG